MKESPSDFHRRPEGYDIEEFCNRVFLMYDGEKCTVQLLCENAMMNPIVDRFGDDVKTHKTDDQHFIAEAEVFISPTFFSWIFTYDGTMRIIGPKRVKEQYNCMLKRALSRS